MRKLSNSIEKVLRQVADGYVSLVRVADNSHSTKVRDAIGKGGKNVTRQYDALVARGLVTYVLNGMDYAPRSVVPTLKGEELLAKLGLPGKHIITDTANGYVWEMREEADERLRFVIYRDGRAFERAAGEHNAFVIFRSYCPWVHESEKV